MRRGMDGRFGGGLGGEVGNGRDGDGEGKLFNNDGMGEKYRMGY